MTGVVGFGRNSDCLFRWVIAPHGRWNAFNSLRVQICQNDRNFYSYVEMPVRCQSADTQFNVVVDATLLDRNSTSLGRIDDALMGVVAQSRGNEDDEAVTSALCVFRMSEVRERFAANVRRCFAGRQKYVGLQFSNRMCVPLVSTRSRRTPSRLHNATR